MRKITIRNGMRLILASLLLIVITSFFLHHLGNVLSFSSLTHQRFYQFGIFLSAVLGGYGVVVCAFGLILPSRAKDSSVRLLPLLFFILAAISFFFYLAASSFDTPLDSPRDRLRPGESITI